jgi:hypothetical protein
MKKRLPLTILIIAFALVQANAQNDRNNSGPANRSGLGILLGATVNYYYGLPDRNFDQFENDRVNWQLNGALGITLARDKVGRRTMIAAFGGLGFNNSNTIKQLLQDQQYTTAATRQSGANNFYQLEGGVIIADVLRLSTGVGQQNFNQQALVSPDGLSLNAKYLKYNSSTVGFNLNFGNVAWVINCNFAYGQDYHKTVITPATGLMFLF